MKKEDVIVCVHGGHAEVGSRGAVGFIDEVECDRWIAREIREVLREHGYECYDISVRNGTQTEVLSVLNKRSHDLKATHNISCHFNSFYTETPHGVEIYVPKTWNFLTKEFNRIKRVGERFCEKTRQLNRGIKIGNNLYVCNNLDKCILVEFAFVSNKEESKLYETEKKCRKKARKFAEIYIKQFLEKEVDA